VPEIFDQLVSSCEKNRRCSHADKEWKFSTESAHVTFGAFGFTIRLCPSRHGREHIESAAAMQSARTQKRCASESRCLKVSDENADRIASCRSMAGGLRNMDDHISISSDEAICVRKD
jgi:hypothetical protein